MLKAADTIYLKSENATQIVRRVSEAVLSRAFRGELVPTEADLARQEGREYETAADRLKRLGDEVVTASTAGRLRTAGDSRVKLL